jgi:hypothetical protein
MKPVLACFFVLGIAAIPASAQTVVRLDVESETWLSPLVFDVGAEVAKRLRDANIQVTDALDAPLVQVSYVERRGEGNTAGSAPATLINFRFRVKSLDAGYVEEFGIRTDGGPEVASADELRARATQTLVQNKRFALIGHRVGAALGLASSFRALLDAEDPSPYKTALYENVLNALSWSSDVDDLCQRSLEAVRDVSHRGPKYVSERAERFLKKNFGVLVAASHPMRAPLLAIDEIAEYGDGSSSQVLIDLMVNPQLATSAYAALRQIDARANGTLP